MYGILTKYDVVYFAHVCNRQTTYKHAFPRYNSPDKVRPVFRVKTSLLRVEFIENSIFTKCPYRDGNAAVPCALGLTVLRIQLPKMELGYATQ